jgi:hypothetical protein
VWVGNENSGYSVTVISQATGKLVSILSSPAYQFDAPCGITSDASHVWVANYKSESVTELPT